MGLLNIYNASAGSGKTYTLVYNYLRILFTPANKNSLPPDDTFKSVLAITFTNKAAWEMKSRILSTLEDFSANGKNTSNSMFFDLIKSTGLTDIQMQRVAGDIISAIYSDYSAFAVCTIDSFTARLVRSFSRELKLPIGFNVVVEASDILNESIDMLLLKAGKENEALTSLLLDFVNEKVDNGSAWDISSILQNSGNIWNKEDSIEPMETLSNMKIEDFKRLLNIMSEYKKGVDDSLCDIGTKACELIDNVGGADFFYRGKTGIVGLFKKAKNKDFNGVNIQSTYVTNFINGTYCSGKVSKAKQADIENIAPTLIGYYNDIEKIVNDNFQVYNLVNILRVPIKNLSVANEIKNEVEQVKKRSSVMLLREFNEIISHHLRNEPVPFIYEKIGERYRHYFIDEFQDTSHLQWENLKHLIYNQIAGSGSALIVGDAKQAIYRWRGGDSEQFIDLCAGNTELKKEQINVQNLDTNYRSSSVIVDFTNDFFTKCSSYLPDEQYQKMYKEGNTQKSKKEFSGFVSIANVEGKTVNDRNPIMLQRVIDEVRRVKKDGFSYRDIAILCRNKKSAPLVASALAKEGIPVVSTESLLLSESSYVGFVLSVLRFINNSSDLASRVSILYYMEKKGHLMGIGDINEYKANCLSMTQEDFLKEISSLVNGFSSSTMYSLPLYEMIEYVMRVFDMWNGTQDAYLLRFLDCVHEFSTQNAASVSSFLNYWDTVKDSVSISSPSDADAVRLLTVHKSKGLEYPVVIFPFASWEIEEYKEEVWIDIPQNTIFNDLKTSLIKLSDVKKVGLDAIYEPYSAKVRLDNLNIFYVAATRASRQLHILTSLEVKGIAECIKMFLDNTPECHHCDPDNIYLYSIGERSAGALINNTNKDVYELNNIESHPWKNRLKVSLSWKKLWTSSAENAIEYGNMLHEVLSYITTEQDVQKAVGRAVLEGIVDEKAVDDVVTAVNEIVQHSELKDYYSIRFTPMSERELITPQGDILRPDRVCLDRKKAVVIDYKTGAPKNAHQTQIITYADVLKKMGYSVEKCLLVYIGEKQINVQTV
ncbi:MAG: UvrD-helicase domain-containing protein [Flavobacteriales bacterium]|nr:UvrD-helicase domain-containing protein [Flavobacteriales bacterium]